MTEKIRKCRRGHDIAGKNVARGVRPDTGEYWPRCKACYNTHQHVRRSPEDKPRFQELSDWKYKTYTS